MTKVMGLFKNTFYFFDEKITKNRHGRLDYC